MTSYYSSVVDGDVCIHTFDELVIRHLVDDYGVILPLWPQDV